MVRLLNCLFIAIAGTSVATSAVGAAEPVNPGNPTHVQYQIRNGQVKCRGVNLAGWLVGESWINPSSDIWKGAPSPEQGEYSAIANAKDPDAVRALFDRHHATFITENDIAEIAAAGLNAVRVPVGHWITGVDVYDLSNKQEWKVYSNGTLHYLDLLVTDWANKHNVAVLIDVHAAKGAQNGLGSASPSVPGSISWSKDPLNVDNTVEMVSFLANRYKDQDSFLGIGLLNEPSVSVDTKVLYEYYTRAYKAVRFSGNQCILTIMPIQTEQEPGLLASFMTAPEYINVWVEWHPNVEKHYESRTDVELVQTGVKENIQSLAQKWNSETGINPLFFGQWNFATHNRFVNNKELFYEYAAAVMVGVNQVGSAYWTWRVENDETTENMYSLRSVLRDEKLKAIMFPSAQK